MRTSRALPADRSRLTQVMHLMGFDQYAAPETDSLSFRWESDRQPSPLELNEVIAQQQQVVDAAHRHEELRGVRFKSDNQIY